MAIDIETERLIAITRAHERFQSKPHPGTIFRWWRFGVNGRKLETVKIGGKRYTSEEAIERFILAINGESTSARLPSHRAKEITAANRRTALAGI